MAAVPLVSLVLEHPLITVNCSDFKALLANEELSGLAIQAATVYVRLEKDESKREAILSSLDPKLQPAMRMVARTANASDIDRTALLKDLFSALPEGLGDCITNMGKIFSQYASNDGEGKACRVIASGEIEAAIAEVKEADIEEVLELMFSPLIEKETTGI